MSSLIKPEIVNLLAKNQGVVGTKLQQKNPLRNFNGFNLVVMDGIEPPTQGFSVLCSTD